LLERQALIQMSRNYLPSLTEATRIRICHLVEAMPGLKSREIARRLGIDRRELNRFLHYEGRINRGLYVRNWRWYSSGIHQPDLLQGPTSLGSRSVERSRGGASSANPEVDLPITRRTMCGILAGMNELSAIRQIRRLDRVAIEKSFSEDEYSSLTDVLKIELIQRLEELKHESSGGERIKIASGKFLAVGALILVVIVALIVILD
jgi:hypothetical protein